MLQHLHVENFALIDTLDLEFGPGMGVLTGETGAGKSIIVDALNALLGERVGAECVREGDQKAFVQAAFDVADHPGIAQELEAQGFETGESLIISREISRQGRTQCRINGRLATVGALREITQLLADVHGQHEHQLLLSTRWQMEFLDAYAGPELLAAGRELQDVWARLQTLRDEHASLVTNERERQRLADMHRFEVAEIDKAALQPGEEEDLKGEGVRLANREKLFNAAQTAHALLSGEEGAGDGSTQAGAIDQVALAARALQAVAACDAQAGAQAEVLSQALIVLEEGVSGVREWRDGLDLNPQRIDEVQARLDVIGVLKRKYGDTIPEILAFRDRAAKELEDIETSDERRAGMEAEITQLAARADELAEGISAWRKAAAAPLRKKVERELADLGMEKARFLVGIEPGEPGPRGHDRVEFLISANPGESPRPLAKVASGGEASRTMLALKTVLTTADPVGTLVFDEVDAGIGGQTANVVGQKLKGLAEGRQVLCVTHLAQIARFADVHMVVRKGESAGRTVVSVRRLQPEERVTELARMLSGDQESEAAVRHARELLHTGVS